MNDFYELQNQVPQLEVPSAVTVIGAGGTGFWFALFAAMSGIRRIVVFEPSKIRKTDVGRFPVRPGSVGSSTIEELEHLVKNLRPDIDFVSHGYFFEHEKHCELIEGKLIISCDDLKLKKDIAEFCHESNIEFVIAPYFPNASAVFHNEVPDELLMDGKSVPNWVGNCAMSAALGITSLFGQSYTTVVSPRFADRDVVDRQLELGENGSE